MVCFVKRIVTGGRRCPICGPLLELIDCPINKFVRLGPRAGPRPVEALALLEYPYIRSVTKSGLVSMTTRQAIGNLLFIFNWLIGFIGLAKSAMNDKGEQQSLRVKILIDSFYNPN